jgi:Cdc6-like AAA superfamily ATPase
LSFAAYTVNEISDIIKGRLKHANAEDLIHPMAVELCARKVSTFGDFRKALDVCRYAFDLLDTELKQQPQSESILPKVTVKHMVRALDSAFGSANASISKLKAFTPNQKAIIVTMLLVDRYNRQPEDLPRVETTLLRVYEVYMNIARKQSALIAVSRSEFMDLIVGCENAGLISVLKPSSTPAARSTSATSTPKSKVKSANGTPGAKTPTSMKKSLVMTPKAGSLLDPLNRLVLQMNEEEVTKGVDDVPHLLSLVKDGIDDAVFKRFK